MKRRLQSGFTLIELMIVVAVVAILAAIAYPSYTSSVVKGKRAEGRAALVELMQQQERFMTQRNTYATWAVGASTGDALLFKTYSGDSVAKASYLMSAAACPGAPAPSLRECVVLTAVRQFADPEAGDLQVLSTGQKTCSGGSKPAVCW